jgi:uncharacterized protein (DUF1697 family)
MNERAERLVAFLRGINLGKRRLTNDRLREVVEAAGLDGVAVYQAAGNVVFDDPGGTPDAVARALEGHFEGALGYRVDTFVRSMAELRAAVAWVAPREAQSDGFKVHLLFLREAPGAEAGRRLRGLETDDDRFAVRGREIYWFRRGGLGTASISAFEPGGITDGETGTMRTLGTVRRIVEKFG